jgi:hypothetical protein
MISTIFQRYGGDLVEIAVGDSHHCAIPAIAKGVRQMEIQGLAAAASRIGIGSTTLQHCFRILHIAQLPRHLIWLIACRHLDDVPPKVRGQAHRIRFLLAPGQRFGGQLGEGVVARVDRRLRPLPAVAGAVEHVKGKAVTIARRPLANEPKVRATSIVAPQEVV